MSNFFRLLSGLSVLLAVAVGCENTPEGGSADAVKCGAGQEKAFDPKTGAAKCVDSPDGGSLGNDGKDGDTGAVTDTKGSDLKATTKDNGEEPDPDVVTNPPDWLVSPTCPAGATGLERWWNCAPTKQVSGALHGKKCAKDEDCLYGHCMFGHPMAAYDPAIGFCAKNCKYTGGGEFTSCSKENGINDPKFECGFEKTKNSGNDKRNEAQVAPALVFAACLKHCQSSADCVAWNPDLPDCTNQSTKYISVGANKVCVRL